MGEVSKQHIERERGQRLLYQHQGTVLRPHVVNHIKYRAEWPKPPAPAPNSRRQGQRQRQREEQEEQEEEQEEQEQEQEQT